MVIRRISYLLACLALLCCCTSTQLLAQQNLVSASVASQLPAPTQLYFTPNEGQWPDENHSIAQAVIPGGAVFVTNSGIRILSEDQQNIQRKHQIHHFKGQDTQFTLSYHVTDLAFLNAQTPTAVQYHDIAPWKENYFLGHQSDRWKSVSPARKITLKNLYPGIDIDIYFHQQTLEALRELVQAAGLHHPSEISAHHIVRRVNENDVRLLSNLLPQVRPGALLQDNTDDLHRVFTEFWAPARADRFGMGPG